MLPLPLALNEMTIRDLPFAKAVDVTVRAGFAGLTPWLDNIAPEGAAAARRMLADAGLKAAGLCFCGFFTAEGPEGRTAVVERAKGVIDTAAEMGAPMVVGVMGGLFPGSKDLPAARAFAFDCLAEVALHAHQANVIIGLEPLHPMNIAEFSIVSTLAQANDWAEQIGAGVGVIIDSYHCWWDPALSVEIARAGRRSAIVSYHLADWLMPTTDLMNDRGVPGDGVVDFGALTGMILDSGYQGWMEVELFSTRLWSGDQSALPEQIARRVDALLGAGTQ